MGSYTRMVLLKIPQINETGAIQPCQTPVKNPAGLSDVLAPLPGAQLLRINTTEIIINIRNIFLKLIAFPLSEIILCNGVAIYNEISVDHMIRP